MKKLIFILSFLGAQYLSAHNVYPLNNTIYLSPQGPIAEDLIVQHEPGEGCIVTASVSVTNQPSPPLVLITNPGGDTAFDVDFLVSALRAPNGASESVTITGSWHATHVTTSGGTDASCSGSGPISMTVTVFADKPPAAPPTISVIFNPMSLIDPVSAATGELTGFDEHPDLDLGGPINLSFRRFYASLLSNNGARGALGKNWMHNFDVNLSLLTNIATVTLFRGKAVSFSLSGGAWQLSGTEQRPYQFASAGSNDQFMDPTTNLVYTFNSGGALTAIADRNGNTLTVTQASGGVGPASVSDGLGRTLTFTYSGTTLTKVADQSGRTVSFASEGSFLTGVTDPNGKTTSYSNTFGLGLPNLIASMKRPNGNIPYTQSFDSAGRVSTQTDSAGNKMTLSYSATAGTTLTETGGVSLTAKADANYNVSSVSDPSGGVSSYSYDANSRPTATTDRIGNQSKVTWDAASGLPASYTDERGNTTTLAYSISTVGSFKFYDLASVQFSDGSKVTIARDSKGNAVSLTDQGGNAWQSTYTSNGLLASLTNPAGGVFTFTYNSDGTQSSMKLPTGDTTKFAYDSAGRMNQVTNADNSTKTFQFDAAGNPLKITDERSNSASATFDGNNNNKTSVDALGATTNFAYDGNDQPTTNTDPLGKATTTAYDTQSRVKSVTNATSNSVNFTYDKLNRVTGTADASGNGFTFSLDGEGRVLTTTDALSRATNYTRDAHGNITAMSTPKSEKFTYSFDSLNRLSSATDPLGRSVLYSRDARGLTTGISLPGGIGASFGLDSMGQPTTVTDPVGNVWTRTFDSTGRLNSTTDPLNRKTSVAYDSRQRIGTVTLPTGNAQYSYDAAGNVTALKYSDNTNLTYTWDANNRMTAASGISLGYDSNNRITASNGLQITRDAAGRIATVVYGQGKTVTYSYNNRGFLSQVSDWVGGGTTFGYDAAGQLTSVALANGLTHAYTWDANSRVTSITVAKGGTTLASVTLTRDALGRITGAARSSANIPSEVKGSLPLAFDAASQVIGNTYDSMGRVTKDLTRNYIWDLASRLSSYSGTDGTASFTYDAAGQRLSRTSGNSTQNYVWNYASGLPTIATVQSGGADQTYYVWLPNGTLLNSIAASDNSRRFYSFDESGSAMVLTDSNGAVTDTFAISVFGDTVTQAGSTATPFTWQGKFGAMREGTTPVYYMRARYYDGATARFLSRDPLSSSDPRDMSPYQFVHANPVESADPTGMDPDDNPPGARPAYDFDPTLYLLPVRSGRPPDIDKFVNDVYNNLFPGPGGPPSATSSGPSTSSSGPIGTTPLVNTVLLYPFMTNQLGFDTGLAIANTSTDPFGTRGSVTQDGRCTLNFYGCGAPAPVTQPTAPSGTIYSTPASSATPGFQGYLIAQCQFQQAHGFAFVSDVGARNLANGYLSAVLGESNRGAAGTSCSGR